MDDSLFLRACRCQPVPRTPLWIMRQAGRYLPEYRELRSRHGMLEVCKTPELALEVTLQPLRRFPLDAAIIFADILLPLEGMGMEFGFEAGQGPVIQRPIGSEDDIQRLREVDPEADLGYVLDALRLVRRELDPSVALIGFAGAPFTLASYMIEGGKSRNFRRTKQLMYDQGWAWTHLMQTITRSTTAYLRAQSQAGAQALQLFDSWVGCLSPQDYRTYVVPFLRQIFSSLSDLQTPIIYFATDSATLLPQIRDLGASVVGIDWRTPLEAAARILGSQIALQGNLDPAALFAPEAILEEKIDLILHQAPTGHIFNLGHGILPQTPPEKVGILVERVRRKSRRLEPLNLPGRS